MDRKTFSLLSENGDESIASFHEVDGTWIHPITGVDTFIWSDMDEDICEIHGPFEVFHVVEARSGICIGRGFHEEEAIDSAKCNVRCRGRESLHAKVIETIRRYGMSPAYRVEEVNCYEVSEVQK